MRFEDSRTKMDVKADRSMESKPFVVGAILAFNEEKTIARTLM